MAVWSPGARNPLKQDYSLTNLNPIYASNQKTFIYIKFCKKINFRTASFHREKTFSTEFQLQDFYIVPSLNKVGHRVNFIALEEMQSIFLI